MHSFVAGVIGDIVGEVIVLLVGYALGFRIIRKRRSV